MKDPIKLIKDDHRLIEQLFRRYQRASKKSDKQEIAGEIVEELSRHAAMEEQLIYPLIRNVDKRMNEPVLNALEEHHAVELVLLEVDKMDATNERFDAKMHVLQESIEMHIEEEEKTLLPRLSRMLKGRQREQLAELIAKAKVAAPTHPHPMAPEMPGNALAGMVAKMSDLGKDILRRVTDRDRTRAHERVQQRVKAEAHATRSSAGRSRSAARDRRAGAGNGRPARSERR